jgi:hypothetical protein
MPTTDTSERGLESLIVAALTGEGAAFAPSGVALREPAAPYGGCYVQGDPADYDRDHAVDVAKLVAFQNATQPKVVETLALDADGPRRRQFLDRLQGEVAKRGVIDVLRRGIKHRPFHRYTMKQAIQEGFILDVLANYTPVQSYYRLLKTAPDDPEVDVKKARKKLRRYVESHDHAIRRKAEIVVDHFSEQVLARRKLGGEARSMVVTSGIARAIQYYHKDADKIRRVIGEEIPAKVAADHAHQNARKHSDKQNARIEHDKALGRVVTELLADHTELFKQFSDNPSFRKWLADTIFAATYD